MDRGNPVHFKQPTSEYKGGENVRKRETIGDFTIIGQKGKAKTLRYCIKCNVCGRIQYLRYNSFKKRNNTHGNICSKTILQEKRRNGEITTARKWHFYSAWTNMKSRCKPNYEKRHCYYDKGIRCDDYKYFVDFYDDFYEQYQQKCSEVGQDNTTLDRIDNSKGYTLDNCRWASWDEQIDNKDSLLNFKATSPEGNTFYATNLKSFCERVGLRYDTVIVGIHQGNKSWRSGWFFEVCND